MSQKFLTPTFSTLYRPISQILPQIMLYPSQFLQPINPTSILAEDHILNGKKPARKMRLKALLKRRRRKHGREISFEQPLRRETKLNKLPF
jgi:hypothetical protein